MYKIGELSKIVNLPIKTLRYYNKIGILTPTKTDNLTGYRYYNDESIIECELIKSLKSVNFTLEEINFLNKKRKKLQKLIKDSPKNSLPPKIYKKSYITPAKEEIKLRRKYEKNNIRKNL